MPFAYCSVPRTVYRICYGDNPLAPVPLDLYIDRQRRPGRWDPHDYSYRVLYTADTFENAFKEVLADFRPRLEAQQILAGVVVDPGDATEINLGPAIREYLDDRWAGALIAPEAATIVRIDETASRQMISQALELPQVPKVGDFNGSDLNLPRRASPVVRDAKECGVACSSALTPGAINYSIFEAGSYSGSWMLDLVQHSVQPSLDESNALYAAINNLGLQLA
jgi:RES domain